MRKFICFFLAAVLLIGLLPQITVSASSVSSYSELQAAINAAPAGVQTSIVLQGSFSATGGAINIGHDQNIVLTSASGSTFTFTQANAGQRHFSVSGSLTLQNVTLMGPGGGTAAGGILLSDGALVMETGSQISNAGVSGNGGGVSVSNNSTLTMNGGTISNNSATGSGGGVYAEGGSVVTINGGLITRNAASVSGGGLYIANGATLNITSGDITLNSATASNSSGGGIGMSSAKVNIDGGLINGNRAFEGGGLYVDSGSMLTMTAGTVSNNIATGDGGGVFSAGYAYADPLWSGAYWNLVIGANVIFSGNVAGNGARVPPGNVADATQIKTTSSSVYTNPVNNFDINFYGAGSMVTYFTVTFDAAGHGSFPAGSVTQQNIPITNNPRVPTSVPTVVPSASYGFIGWSSDGGLTTLSAAQVLNTSINANTTYVAQYIAPIKLTFDAQGGTPSLQTVTDVQIGATYAGPLSQISTPTKTGYVFRGWFTAPEGSGGVQILHTSTVTTKVDQTLYAYWQPNPTVTISFDAQGGSPSMQNVPGRVAGSTYAATLKAVTQPTLTGSVFTGWFTSPSGGTQITDASIIPNTDTVVYAQWKLIPTITIVFDPQGGLPTILQSRTVQTGALYDTAMSSVPNPSKRGYAFAGWYTTPNGDNSGVQVLPSAIVTSIVDQTLYAHWDSVTITVTFDANTGTPEKQYATGLIPHALYGSALSSITIPTLAGYTFLGWFTALSGGTEITQDTTIPSVNTTVFAHWSPNADITVSFDANGGDPVMQTQQVRVGTTYASAIGADGAVIQPTLAGYTFLGWFTASSNGLQIFETTVVKDSDSIFYARWSQDPTVTITFDANGGTPDIQVAPGQIPLSTYAALLQSISAPTLAGYTFQGWFSAPSGGTQITATTDIPAVDTTVYAQWSQIPPVTITFNGNGGTPGSQSANISIGSPYSLAYDAPNDVVDPSSSGNIFIGWFDQSTGGTQIFDSTVVTATSPTVLYAHWITDPTTLTTFLSNASGGTPDIQVVVNRNLGRDLPNYASTLTAVRSPSLTDQVFLGWFTEPTGGTQITPTSPKPSGNVTLYAHWADIPTINITFDAQGGFPNEQKTALKNGHIYGEAFAMITTPTQYGRIFTGWFTTPNGDSTGVQILDNTVLTALTDQTLYAHWVVSLVTLNFDAQGGLPALQSVTGKIPGVSHYSDSYASITQPTRDGYTFVFWQTTPDSGAMVFPTDRVPDVDTTVYAHWEPIQITIYFDAQGAIPDMQSGPAVTGGSYASAFSAIITPTMAGSTFLGWFTQIIGGTQISAEDIVTQTTDQTLYARFRPTPITPTVPPSGAPGSPGESSEPPSDTPAPNLDGAEDDTHWNVTLTKLHQSFLIGDDERLITPTDPITRSEVATVLMRIISDDTRAYYWTLSSPFPDVPNNGGAWYSNAISVANNAGLMTGFPSGNFYPDRFMSRAEVVTVMSRLIPAHMHPETNGDSFSDISDSWARHSINVAAQFGWVQGFSDGTFNPSSAITRAELATMVNRMTGFTKDDIDIYNMVTWADNANTDAWYYWAMQIASNSAIGAPMIDWITLQQPNAHASHAINPNT